MYKIGIASGKGGVGKTTLAWNLCGYWHNEGLKVCLADIDEQQNAFDMSRKGKVPFTVMSAIPSGGYDVCVIDHAPGTKTQNQGDIIVRPIKASALDLASFKRFNRMFVGKKVIPVITMLRLNSSTQMEIALEMKKDHKAFWVKQRTIYETAMSEGCTIDGLKKSQVRYEAMNEIALIAQKVEICLTS